MTEKTEPLTQSPISRIVTVICDHIPLVGRIKEHRFVSTLGEGAVFTKTPPLANGFEAFSLSICPSNQVWTAQELRELADECLMMAKYLEKLSA